MTSAKGAEMKPSACPVVAWLCPEDGTVYGGKVAAIPAQIASDLLADPAPNWKELIRQSDHLAALAERDALIERYRNALTVIINSPGGGPAKRIATQVLGEYLARATQAASEGEGKL